MCPGLVQAGHKTPVTEHSPEYLGHIVGNISVIFLEHWCAVRVGVAPKRSLVLTAAFLVHKHQVRKSGYTCGTVVIV